MIVVALSGDYGATKLESRVSSLVLPNSIQSVLATRVDTLTSEQKKLLRHLSVIGKTAPVDLLTTVVDLDRNKVVKLLGLLVEKGFIYETQRFPEQEYGFVNNITRDVVYHSILKKTRKEIHLKVLSRLEDMFSGNDLRQVEIKAQHASSAELWEKGFHYYDLASMKAFTQSSVMTAVSHFDGAFDCYDRFTPGDKIKRECVLLFIKKYHCFIWLGRNAELGDLIKEPVKIAKQLKDKRLEAILHANEMVICLSYGDYEQAETMYYQLLKVNETLHDDIVEVQCNMYASHAFNYLGKYAKSLACAQKVMAYVEEHFSGDLLSRDDYTGLPTWSAAVFYHTFSCGELGLFDKMKSKEKESSLALATARPGIESVMITNSLSLMKFYQGDIKQAVQHLTKTLSISDETGIMVLEPISTAQMGYMLSLLSKDDEAKKLLDRCFQHSEMLDFCFKAAVMIGYLGEGYFLINDFEKAKIVLKKMFELAELRKQRAVEAQAWRLKAELSIQENDVELTEAESSYQAAIKLGEKLEMKPFVAHCHRGLYKLYKKMNQPEKATKAFAAANDYFEKEDMIFWIEHMQQLQGS